MWGAPVAPGGRGGMDMPPGGGGGMESLPGCPSIALIRGGGRFTPAGGGGPPIGGRAFSILKWNCRKNCEDENRLTTYFSLKMLLMHVLYEKNLFSFSVPVGPEAGFSFINFSAGNLKKNTTIITMRKGKIQYN